MLEKTLLSFFLMFNANSLGIHSCTPDQINIKEFNPHVEYTCPDASCPVLKITGKISNHCEKPVGVLVRIVVRDSTGEILEIKEGWPANIQSILPKSSYPFNMGGFFQYDEEMNDFTISVVEVKQW